MRRASLPFLILAGLSAGCQGIDPDVSSGPDESVAGADTPRDLLDNYAHAIAAGDAELFAACIDVSEADKRALLEKLGPFLAMMKAGRELTVLGTKKFGPGFTSEADREARPWDYARDIGQRIVEQVEKAVILDEGEFAKAFMPGSGPEGTRLARKDGVWVLPFSSGQALLAGFSDDVELVIRIFKILGELYVEGQRVIEGAKSVDDFNLLMKVAARPYLDRVARVTAEQAIRTAPAGEKSEPGGSEGAEPATPERS